LSCLPTSGLYEKFGKQLPVGASRLPALEILAIWPALLRFPPFHPGAHPAWCYPNFDYTPRDWMVIE